MRPDQFRLTFSLLVGLIALASSCSNSLFWGLLNEIGKGTETRAVEPFTSIKVNGPGELAIHLGTQSVEIIAKSEALAKITTTVVGTELVINVSADATGTESTYYNITLPNLEGISVSGSCVCSIQDSFAGSSLECVIRDTASIRSDLQKNGNVEIACLDYGYLGMNIVSTNLTFSSSSTIDSLLDGSSTDASFVLEGSGGILVRTTGSPYKASNCRGTIKGSGSLYVNPILTLDASISGSGNIQYWGDPGVTQILSGTGAVIKN